MSDEINDLASTRNFDALKTGERMMVLAAMTEEEYRKLSGILQTAPGLDAEVAPSPHLRAKLMAQFAGQNALKPKLQWYKRPVPLWQAAAVMVLVLTAVWGFRIPVGQQEQPAKTLVRTDTIFAEKVIWKERVVIRKVPVKPALAMPLALNDPDTVTLMDTKSIVSGTSIASQPGLLQFFTRVGEK